MRIGKRDKALLTAVARYGILSTTQVQAKFFAEISKTTMLRRLRLLEEADLIRRVHGLRNAELSWIITKAGAMTIGIDGNLPKYTNQNAIYHEVQLTRARMLLETVGLAEIFTPEFELKRKLAGNNLQAAKENQVPDGLFLADSKGETKTVALELELTVKAWSRYQKVVREYGSKEKIDFVWYLTGDDRVARLLMPLWKNRPKFWRGPELLVSSLHDLETNGAKTVISRSDGLNIPLQALFDLKSDLKNTPRIDESTHELTAHSVSSFDPNPLSRKSEEILA